MHVCFCQEVALGMQVGASDKRKGRPVNYCVYHAVYQSHTRTNYEVNVAELLHAYMYNYCTCPDGIMQ